MTTKSRKTNTPSAKTKTKSKSAAASTSRRERKPAQATSSATCFLQSGSDPKLASFFCLSSRSLAGKPLAGFYATPIRRITVLYGTVVYVLR